ncbi:hypothetical protein [Dethiothermospora halolimnae]|uniref:hypothetical protein n=1 Tax=Dethiothermospora halolimnae TaxID=3114390 RepID=UPI003CCBA52B
MEKLPLYVETTKLGKRFKPLLTKVLNLVTGYKFERINVWDRLDKAIEILLYGDKSKEAYELSEACDKAMIDLGIEKYWVEAGYDNIDELLHGKLGPTP